MKGLGGQGVLGAAGFSLLVHAALIGALALGVSWSNPPLLPVQARLWTDLPPMQDPSPSPPQQEPQKKSVPKKVPPKPPEKPRSQQPAEIALQKARKRREAEVARAQAAHEAAQIEAARKVRARDDLERMRQEAAHADLDKELSALDQQRAARAQRATQAQQAKQRQLLEAQNRIRLKIRGLLQLPPGLEGNPEVVYRVTLLPGGDVDRVELISSSGQPEYDRKVERAILKASPLPLPADTAMAREFRGGLTLRFRPHEG